MQPIGHGIDVVDVPRIERLLAHDSEAFVGWLTEKEIAELGDRAHKAEVIAVRIAVKEAVAKALGTGFAIDVSWQDIEVRISATGAPSVVLSGGAALAAEAAGVDSVLLSISQTHSLAAASAIAIGRR